jgi:pSer/pThr/pTyr-binding forkhead associated (FHA) protein
MYAGYHIDACIQMGGTFIMDKCPYCGAETRQGDNFCLNCGNRLLSATPSPLDQQAGISEATVATPEDWNAPAPSAASTNEAWGANNSASGEAWGTNNSTSGEAWGANSSAPAEAWGVDNSASSGASWGAADNVASTAAASVESLPTIRESAGAGATAQATIEKIEEPGYLTLRSDSGEMLQEYPLDKTEVVIGRAPNSEILLSKDKLTSRRHATVHYENGQYLLQDEHSANGTFVNAQQLDEDTPYLLQDGDHVGIGEHELVFRASSVKHAAVEDLPTIAVPYESAQPATVYHAPDDAPVAISPSVDYSTSSVEPKAYDELVDYGQVEPQASPVAEVAPVEPAPVSSYEQQSGSGASEPAPVAADAGTPADGSTPVEGNITLNRFSAIAVPPLPDMTSLMAALSSLDGQIMSLQGQFNATQDALKRHDTEIGQTAGQLRTSIRRISERMETTIADVARSREALAWAELLQLMEDVMNNPRDIEYVTKLARKARELNKVFQIHQNVLNTMAECNNQLRSLIGEEK